MKSQKDSRINHARVNANFERTFYLKSLDIYA